MPKQNIYTAKKAWVAHTPYKGKKDNFFAPIGELFSEENGGHLVPQSDVESPNKVLKTLWSEFKISEIKPFCYIRTGANIWEYYLLRMHGCSKNRYDNLRTKPARTFGNLRRVRLGFTYDDWLSRYEKIDGKDGKTLKNASKDFISALKRKSDALRFDYREPNYTKSRKNAAKAFFSYLTSGKEAIIKKLLDKPTLYDILILMIQNEKNECKKEHLYCISLMLCLYGRKDEAAVSRKLAKMVSDRLNTFKSGLATEINLELKKVSNNFKKDFKPPFAWIYGYYQDRANILFRLTTWLALVESTFRAYKEE